MKKEHKKGLPAAVALVLALTAWLFVGVLNVYRMEDESYTKLFVKSIPTFRLEFDNPYRSDPSGEEDEYRKRMDVNFDWLPQTRELIEFLQYCKYRYGVTEPDQIKARTQCKKLDGINW